MTYVFLSIAFGFFGYELGVVLTEKKYKGGDNT